MSVKIMGAIWDLDLPHELAWVLMAYADHADHDGGNCYPGVRLIAYKTGYSERQVQRCTADLIARKVLIVDRAGGGRGNATVYRINLSTAPHKGSEPKAEPEQAKGDKMSPFAAEPETVTAEPERVTSATERVTEPGETVTKTGLKGDIAMSPQPLTVNPSTVIEPSGTGGACATQDWHIFCQEADAIVGRAVGRPDGFRADWDLSGSGLLRCGIREPHLFVAASRHTYLSSDIARAAVKRLGRRVAVQIGLAP